MKKLIVTILSLVLLIAMVTGCSKQNGESNVPADSLSGNDENPFDAKNNDQGSGLESIGHGLDNPELDANGKRLPLRYKGGEMKIDYLVHASGKAKNVGFLVFVNGIAQPYKFNTTDAPYEYMHIFDLEEDNKDTIFSFVFTPVTGKKGETLEFTITSIYNPAFIPDMKETNSYGNYHSTLDGYFTMIFEQDAALIEASDIPQYDCLRNVRQSTEPVTKEILASLASSSWGEVNMETLNSIVFVQQYFDNTQVEKTNNLKINSDGTLHVTFKIVGHPGVRYRNTFYLNHQALTDGESVSFETEMTKGNVSVIEVNIELEKLKTFNTFYVVSTPLNATDFPDDVITLKKTSSILLYK